MHSGAQRIEDGPWAGWIRYQEPEGETFLSGICPSYARADTDRLAIVRIETRPMQRNRLGGLHGGLLATFADHAYFAGLVAMGRPEQLEAVTIDLSMQYLGVGRVGPVLEATVELLRETGRLMFLRLTIAQDGDLVAASTATIRKARAA